MSLIPFLPALKLGLLPATHAALVEIQDLAAELENQLFVGTPGDPRGLQIAVAPPTEDTAAHGLNVEEEFEHRFGFLDYSPTTGMFLLLDEDGITHRVSSPRAVFGLIW